MGSLKWRKYAKVAAIVDIVLISIGFVAVLCLAFLLGFWTDKFFKDFNPSTSYNSNLPSDIHSNNEPSSQQHSGWTISISFSMVCVTCAILVLQMCAALKLLNATNTGNSPQDSFGKARIWRNIAVVFLVLMICVSVFRLYKVLTMTHTGILVIIFWFNDMYICVRGLQICAVTNFMKELERLCNQNSGNMYMIPMKE